MKASVMEVLVHFLLILLYGIVAAILGIVGLYVEYYSVITAIAGDMVMGIWTGVFGLILIAFAYLIVRDRAVPTAREFAARSGVLTSD